MVWNKIGNIAALSLVILVVACGDDSSSSGPENATASDFDLVLATFDDLPTCSSKREGVTAYVKDEKIAYVCENADWVEEYSDKVSSIGKNKSSSSSDKIKSSSSVEFKQDSTAYDTLPVVAVKNKSISGVLQKGPFVTGSAIKLYELDGENYVQTGKSFMGKIASDDGKFVMSSVTLASQYALFEANGYFRNEITGKKSSGTITLNALADLSERKSVNVNLLTHLEYERALYLVGMGINVLSAKKQAETEIFNAFGIQGEFANSEDLDIFSKSDGNAALLAFSVLMLRDLSEADLTELLTKFATDIEKDGQWDDEATKAKIADWAQLKDVSGGLDSIRSNIKNWNLGTVPDFEKYVRNFWYKNYKLGDCDKAREGDVIATKNELSTTYGTNDRFICKSSTWVEASDAEKDFYKSEKSSGGADGELWEGLLTGKIYKYDLALDKWVMATHNDTTLKLMGCTANRMGEIGKSSTDDVYYVCENSDWRTAQEIDLDTYGEKCTSKEVGKTIEGVVTSTNKYYCTERGWVGLMGGWSWNVPKVARLNPEITYGAMMDSRDGKKYKTVVIGDQTWMAENLNYADSTTTVSLKGKSWCYNNVAANCGVAGRLYTWAATIDSVKLANDADDPQNCGSGKTCTLPAKVQGICPTGWHLPTQIEWSDLFTAVGGLAAAGKVLKSLSGWYSNGNGTDAAGFSALPAGSRDYDGDFNTDGSNAYFWSASAGDDDNAYYLYLHYRTETASLGCYYKSLAFSIRCVKDSEE